MRKLRASTVRRFAACVVALTLSAGAGAADVTVALERFGALRAYRPGDVTGIRLRIASSRPEPVECIVQWDLDNADGDLVAHTRAVTLAPNQPLQRWLYARLPPSADPTLSSQTFTVRVFEARDGVRARELASLRFGARDAEEPSQPVGMHEDLIALLAGGRLGLEALEAVIDGGEVPAMNETTRLATSVRTGDLPDRWEGLISASVLVWSADGPQSLSAEGAAALMQWIERGGHLVIVLPESGDPWQIRGASHPLAALLPRRGAARVDGLAIEPLLPLLTKGGSMRRGGFRMAATLFDEASLEPAWRTLVRVPEGALPRGVTARSLVVQRAWGHGRVTIVGLDLDSLHRGAVVADGAPQADVFWNAILGRRADAPSEGDYRAWQEAKPRKLLSSSDVSPFEVGDDGFVLSSIGQFGRATAGVLVLLVFFVLYWLIAVPGTWLALRRRARAGWAWPAFAASALAAVPIAWTISRMFGGSDVQVRHLTVADYVMPSVGDAAPATPRIRATVWMSVALGGFGTSEVAIDEGPDERNLLIDWASLRSDGRRFPDTARSDRSVDRSGALRSPARATTTDMQAWWMGAVPAWNRVAWQVEDRPVAMVLDERGEPRVSLRGAIRHGLGQPLRDVQLVLTLPYRFIDRRWKSGPGSTIEPDLALPPRPVLMAALSHEWGEEALDLNAAMFPKGPMPVASIGDGSIVREMAQVAEAAKSLVGASGRLAVEGGLASLPVEKRLGMLSLFQMLAPPPYTALAPPQRNAWDAADTNVRMQRRVGRELDLSAWLVRPCLIVTGFLDRAESPVPIRLNGEPASSEGTVMVRLVLPLDEPDRGPVRPFRPGP